MTEVELAAIGVAAIIGGAVSALAGGGTLITFPVLLAVGVPSVPANVTNTVALCTGYLGGTLAERKDLSGEKRKILAFGVTSALGGFVGGVLLLNTGEATFRALVPYLILLAAVLLVIEEPIHRWHERGIGQSGPRHVKQPVAIDSDISGLRVWRLFRRRTGHHCTRGACARGPRIHHQAERFETNDLAMRKRRRRSSFLVLEQGDLVGGDRDGRWGFIGGSHRRIRGRPDSAFCAARHCRGICRGNRHCIFCSIERPPVTTRHFPVLGLRVRL